MEKPLKQKTALKLGGNNIDDAGSLLIKEVLKGLLG